MTNFDRGSKQGQYKSLSLELSNDSSNLFLRKIRSLMVRTKIPVKYRPTVPPNIKINNLIFEAYSECF